MKTKASALQSPVAVLVVLLLFLTLGIAPAVTQARLASTSPGPESVSGRFDAEASRPNPTSSTGTPSRRDDLDRVVSSQGTLYGPAIAITMDADGAMAVHAADLDDDGDVDVLSASRFDNKVAWYENDGLSSPTFTPHVLTTAASWPQDVHAADIDGDGDVDVVYGSSGSGKVVWYENDGMTDPTFAPHVITTNAGLVESVHVADLDGDGDMDILSAGAHDTYQIFWYENDGNSPPAFAQHAIGGSGVWPRSIYAADVDGDGDMDVLSAVDAWNSIYWYENSGGPSPTFASHTVASGVNAPQSVYAADMDGDGDMDVLSAAQNSNTVAWHENLGGSPPTFANHVITADAQYAWSVYATDLDNDDDVDVLSASWADNKVAWYENDGGSPPIFIQHVISTNAMHAFSVHAADIDGDGDKDVLSASYDDDTIAWYENLNQPTPPSIISVEPARGYQGATLDVAFVGHNTHWDSTTTADLGLGIAAVLTTTDATHAEARIAIASDADTGSRTITLTTGAEVVTKPYGFTVDDDGVGPQCPGGLAAKLATGWFEDSHAFGWYEFFGEHTFTTSDTLELSFVVVPFEAGQTLVGMDEVGGRTGYSLYFYDGTIYGADHGDGFANDTPLATYDPDAWSAIKAVYDFGSHQYTLAVNGAGVGPFPFSFGSTNSVQSLRVHSGDADTETFAWLDSMLIVRSSGSERQTLFGTYFDGDSTFTASPGTIALLTPPDDYALPPACAGATLEVNPNLLEFNVVEGGSDPDAQIVFVGDGGTGPLPWTAHTSSGWLALDNIEGTTPATVTVGIDVGPLLVGEYDGTIVISSDGALDSPQTVDVLLSVEPSTGTLALSAESGYDNIHLDWDPAPALDVVSYRVLRAVDEPAGFAAIAVVSDTAYLDDDPTLNPGMRYCYYVEALRSDSSIVTRSNMDCALFGQVELWISDVRALPGQSTVILINIRNATGLSIAACDIWLNFDGTVIEPVGISATPLTADYTWTYAISSTETYSQARIAAFASPPPMLYGEGTLFWLNVRVVGPDGAESPLDLIEFVEGVGGSTIYAPEDLLNPVPLRLQDGTLRVTTGYILGDLNGNGVVQAVDAYIALQIACGAITPTPEQLLAGDVNGNGAIDAADATMILYYAVNGTWPLPTRASKNPEGPRGGLVTPVVLALDDARGAAGTTVQTTLWAENLSDWAGGEMLIAYDTSVIESVVDVQVTSLTSGSALQYHDDGTGLLHIALAGNTAIGSGSLVTITLQIAPTVPCGSSSTLALLKVSLNDIAGRDFATSALQQDLVRYNGKLEVTSRIYLPVIYKPDP